MPTPATLLIVDDDEGVRVLLDAALGSLPASRVIHQDCEGARRYVQSGGRVDVALVDKNLPDGSGMSLIGWLRQEVPTVEALLMTAQTSLDSAIEAMQAGACDYVRKPFDDVDQLKLRVSDALEKVALKRGKALLLEKLWHDALHDPLTGLANRGAFLERLRTSLDELTRAPERLFAALFVDIDRFKHVNDNLGHGEGDKLLIAIGKRLQACVREIDLVARLGGDEFTVLLRELDRGTDVTRICDRIHRALAEPFVVGERELYASASIGVALSSDSRQLNGGSGSQALAEAMLRDANLAMYRAKRTGSGSTQLFDADLQARAQRSWMLESSLRQALNTGEITVAYQPIVSLPTRSLAGFEALVRWRSETLGQVPPMELIAIAEDCGLIDRVFDHVLETAMRQLGEWRVQLGNPELAMSVNLSSKQLRHQGLVDLLLGRLDAAGLPPDALEIEITESALMEDPARAQEILSKVHSAGIGIAIDDFGTGFSSLSYLSRLPVSSLKIDRSFVLEMTKDTGSNIVGFVVELAKHLKLQVVAEGVEREDDVKRLVSHGCGYAQGYLFSRPLAAAEMSRWLSDYRAA